MFETRRDSTGQDKTDKTRQDTAGRLEFNFWTSGSFEAQPMSPSKPVMPPITSPPPAASSPSSKLGPISDEHFENDPQPPGTYAGQWSPEQEARFEERKRKLKQEIEDKK
jgi:hypothetical protein